MTLNQSQELDYLQYPSEGSFSGKSVIVFLHGLGAGANDFSNLPELLSFRNTVEYIFPQAPNLPVTINGGISMPAWYDIKSMELEREVDEKTVTQAKVLINTLLDKIIDKGVSSSNIIIGGFSQGGAMALEVGLNYPKSLAGIISLSAYCLSISKVKEGSYDTKKKLPILFCHGEQDPIVPFFLGDRHQKAFKEKGFNLKWYKEKDLGHHLSSGEVVTIKNWLNQFSFLKS